VHPVSDLRGLLVDAHFESKILVVEALVDGVLADLPDLLTYDGLLVNHGRGGDLAENHDEIVLAHALTGYFGIWIF